MDLFSILTPGQAVALIVYPDEINAIPTHMKTVGRIIDQIYDFYAVDFGGITEIIDGLKLEAV